MAINTKVCNCSRCREEESMDHSVLNGACVSHPLLPRLRDQREETLEHGRCFQQSRVSWTCQGSYTCELRECEGMYKTWADAYHLMSQHRERKWVQKLTLRWGAVQTENCWGRRRQLPVKMYTLVGQPHAHGWFETCEYIGCTNWVLLFLNKWKKKVRWVGKLGLESQEALEDMGEYDQIVLYEILKELKETSNLQIGRRWIRLTGQNKALNFIFLILNIIPFLQNNDSNNVFYHLWSYAYVYICFHISDSNDLRCSWEGLGEFYHSEHVLPVKQYSVIWK